MGGPQSENNANLQDCKISSRAEIPKFDRVWQKTDVSCSIKLYLLVIFDIGDINILLHITRQLTPLYQIFYSTFTNKMGLVCVVYIQNRNMINTTLCIRMLISTKS